ncbi:MAG: EamA family transporter [Candidatus Manganitrophaceae bacterium]
MTERRKAEWLLFATTFIWGGTFIVIKEGLVDLSPLLMLSLRFTLAAVFLLPFSFRSLYRADRNVIAWGGFLGFLIFSGFLLQTFGLRETTASKSAFITGMMVIFTPLFQWIILKRLPKWGNLAGVVLVLIGLWLLTSPSEGGFNRGDFLTLLCAIIFGFFIVLLDMASRQHDVLLLTFLQIIFPALFGWFAFSLFEEAHFRPTRAAFVTLGYTAFLATVVTGYVQTRYQRETTPTRAALIYTLEPLWAALLGFFFLQEKWGWGELFGGMLMISGVLLSELSEGIMRGGRRSNSRQ